MQQASSNTATVHNTINGSSPTNHRKGANLKKAGLVRWIVRNYEMAAIIGLMASSTAYGVLALAQTSL